MRIGAKRWVSVVLIAVCVGAYVYAQGLDLVMRVGGDIISVDPAFGTYTIETSSGPRMTVPDLAPAGSSRESSIRTSAAWTS